MATLLQPAYPFVAVTIDLSGLRVPAQRSPSVVAIVGLADDAAATAANTPAVVTGHDSVMATFAKGKTPNALTNSLDLVLQQEPPPSKIYGVRTDAGKDYASALTGLEAADDVTFVCLANETDIGAAAAGANPPTNLTALAAHVENMSAAGNKQMAVAMVNPATAKSATYKEDVLSAYAALKSSDGRFILVAARGATADAAAAAMGAIAGYPPAVSPVLKQVRGFTVPVTSQYAPAEITGLAEQGVIPLIDPALIPGTGLYFADGGSWSSDPNRNYIDVVRVCDDVEFKLRSGLIGSIGDSRITKAGLMQVLVRTEGILGTLQRAAEIDDFSVQIPLLDVLSIPESARTPADDDQVTTARGTRHVSMFVAIVLGPQIHQLDISLAITNA
ncbi:hypothetical protein [Mycobacterium sp.]|uniref:hypothetical protein n=1 Tax=Mycobacterium sp. TaxID=1785 RepID=UPI003D138208